MNEAANINRNQHSNRVLNVSKNIFKYWLCKFICPSYKQATQYDLNKNMHGKPTKNLLIC